MSSTFTTNFNIEEPAHGDYVDTWDVPVNANMTLLDGALGSALTVPMTSSDVTLSATQATQNVSYVVTGTLTANVNLIFPITRNYIKLVQNNSTGNFTLTVKVASGTGVVIQQGTAALVRSNGTNISYADTGNSGSCPIGTSLTFRGLNIPTSHVGYWVYEYGQTVSRTTYAAAMAAITRTTAATRTSGNATLTSVGDTTGVGLGMPIEGTGIPVGTTVVSVTASTIVMSQVASSGAPTVGTVTIFPYGNGDGSTTFTLPDARGRASIPRDDQGTTAASRITTAGSSINGVQLGATGGAQNVTLDSTMIPAHTHAAGTYAVGTHTHAVGTFVVDSHTHGAGSFAVSTNILNGSGVVRNLSNGDFSDFGAGSGAHNVFDAVSPSTSTISLNSGTVTGTSAGNTATISGASATTAPSFSGTSASTGSDGAHLNVQPTIIATSIIRIL